MFQQDPVLASFRRDEHERVLAEFRELDRDAPPACRRPRSAQALSRAQPAGDTEAEVALLMKEAHKKTKHLPLRRLFEAMPHLLLQLKPCLLMSPLSVSQFLPADRGKCSSTSSSSTRPRRSLPEDAVGAIYRGKQVVVTGDNQQLPPTTFFQQCGATRRRRPRRTAGLFESILDACLGAGLPQQLLRWHYRSRHEHLIAFSNDRIYDEPPGHLSRRRARSIRSWACSFHHVADGVYDRGGRRDNPREAQVVADLVLDHFRRRPDKTLGVIAFSYAQMDAIEDELERRLRDAPELETFFQDDRLEGFFVKNLETVQGDERDVILLSVGYGRDADGKIALNFGPLNREGGERRLNVAVTRARQKLIVVSSIRAATSSTRTPRDPVSAAVSRLRRARHHRAAAGTRSRRARRRTSAGGGRSSELEQRGYKVEPQVGCASYRIDLAVVDPRDPGRYSLGIEFDGPMYEQAATARDRDRLRPEVLEQLGWKLHRIWSPELAAEARRGSGAPWCGRWTRRKRTRARCRKTIDPFSARRTRRALNGSPIAGRRYCGGVTPMRMYACSTSWRTRGSASPRRACSVPSTGSLCTFRRDRL